MKPEVKIEKMRIQLEQDKLIALQLESLLKNPLVEFVLGTLFIAYATRGNQSVLERLTGVDVMAGSMGVGLVGVITAQQLSAAIPYLSQIDYKTAAPMIAGLLK